MTQIVPHQLWLGHAKDGQDFRQLFDAGIKAVVYLAAEEAPQTLPRELIACRFPLLDGTGNRADLLYLAISTVATLIKLHVTTLVCCSSGVSRAPAITAAALSMIHHEPPELCLPRVVHHHPSDISPGFWSEVIGLLPAVR